MKKILLLILFNISCFAQSEISDSTVIFPKNSIGLILFSQNTFNDGINLSFDYQRFFKKQNVLNIALGMGTTQGIRKQFLFIAFCYKNKFFTQKNTNHYINFKLDYSKNGGTFYFNNIGTFHSLGIINMLVGYSFSVDFKKHLGLEFNYFVGLPTYYKFFKYYTGHKKGKKVVLPFSQEHKDFYTYGYGDYYNFGHSVNFFKTSGLYPFTTQLYITIYRKF